MHCQDPEQLKWKSRQCQKARNWEIDVAGNLCFLLHPECSMQQGKLPNFTFCVAHQHKDKFSRNRTLLYLLLEYRTVHLHPCIQPMPHISTNFRLQKLSLQRNQGLTVFSTKSVVEFLFKKLFSRRETWSVQTYNEMLTERCTSSW